MTIHLMKRKQAAFFIENSILIRKYIFNINGLTRDNYFSLLVNEIHHETYFKDK